MSWIRWNTKTEIVEDKVIVKCEADLAEVTKQLKEKFSSNWYNEHIERDIAFEVQRSISRKISDKVLPLVQDNILASINKLEPMIVSSLQEKVLDAMARDYTEQMRGRVLEKINVESMVTAVFAKASLVLAKEISKNE